MDNVKAYVETVLPYTLPHALPLRKYIVSLADMTQKN